MNIQKKRAKNHLLWTIDQQGQLHFPLRGRIARNTDAAGCGSSPVRRASSQQGTDARTQSSDSVRFIP